MRCSVFFVLLVTTVVTSCGSFVSANSYSVDDITDNRPQRGADSVDEEERGGGGKAFVEFVDNAGMDVEKAAGKARNEVKMNEIARRKFEKLGYDMDKLRAGDRNELTKALDSAVHAKNPSRLRTAMKSLAEIVGVAAVMYVLYNIFLNILKGGSSTAAVGTESGSGSTNVDPTGLDSIGPDSIGPDSIGPGSIGPGSIGPYSTEPDNTGFGRVTGNDDSTGFGL